MKYTASHIYQYEDIEVEIIVGQSISTREEAEKIANSSTVSFAFLQQDQIVIGKSKESIIINRDEEHLYQFKVCRDHNLSFRTDDDYEKISWDEALEYAKTHYERFSLPLPLSSLAYAVCKEKKFSFY